MTLEGLNSKYSQLTISTLPATKAAVEKVESKTAMVSKSTLTPFETNPDTSAAEFSKLPESSIYDSLGTYTTSEKHQKQNRYADILPNEHSRFTIEGDEEFYFNANWVLDETAIASQGPLKDEHGSFWKMVFASKASIIVMLTNLQEPRSGRLVEKCSRYWVEKEEEPKELEGITLTCLSAKKIYKKDVQIIERTFQLTNQEGQTHAVTHYHLLDWADFRVIETTSLNTFVKFVYNKNRGKKTAILVHCSAGIGRTGTFLCTYAIYAHMLQGKPVDKKLVFNTMLDLRNPFSGRNGMVQTAQQYQLVYAAANQLWKELRLQAAVGNKQSFFRVLPLSPPPAST